MSEAGESVRTSAEGVRVHKRFAADEFPVPAIALDISSGREKQVTVELSDRVPDGIDVDDLGFHPDHGSEHWTIEADQIRFEREFAPGESYTTVYGIRTADDLTQFLDEPTLESVEPPLSATERGAVLESDDALVEDAIADSAEPSTDGSADESDDTGTLDLGGVDHLGDSAEGPVEGSTAPSKNRDATTADPVLEVNETVTQEREPVTATETADDPGESLVAALAAELRAGSVAEDDLELLGEAVVDAHPALGSGSVVARLDQLQGDVAELRSYTGALETFLDENGTGEQLVESVQAELDSVDSRLDSLETEVDGRLDSLETEVEQLRSDLTDEIEQQGPGSAEFDELNSRIERVDQELEQLKDWRQRLVETLGD